MKTRCHTSILTPLRVAALASALFGPSLFAQALHDLGTLGGSSSYGAAINNSGQVTGYSLLSGNQYFHAFVSTGGMMTDVGEFPLAGDGLSDRKESFGYGINDSGRVTGAYGEILSLAPLYHAFESTGETISDLGTLGAPNSVGYGINNSGQVVGTLDLSTTSFAFVSTDGVMTFLGTLGGFYSAAGDINNSGQITGASKTAGNAAEHAFVYTAGLMTDLGTLGGQDSAGEAINDSGQVTGLSDTAADQSHAFLYSEGLMNDLGTLDGGLASRGYGINSWGQVVGRSDAADHQYSAFLYSGGVMMDLSSVFADLLSDGTSAGFVHLLWAEGINDSDQITGTGYYFDGTNLFLHAFLLDAGDHYLPNMVDPSQPDTGGYQSGSGGGSVPDATGTLGLLALSFIGLIALKGKFQTRLAQPTHLHP